MNAEFIPVTEVEVGQAIAAGTVTAIRYSKSRKTIYFTCRSAAGEKEHGQSAANQTAVFTKGQPEPAAPCDYQPVDGDPAIRVCMTHDPELGLYGDEWCAHDTGSAPDADAEAAAQAFEAVCAAVAASRPGLSLREVERAAAALARDSRVAYTALCVTCGSEPQEKLTSLVRRVSGESS